MIGAGANGLFADHALDVELADPPGGPDNIVEVADGRRDFCLTSVHHYLTARAAAGHELAARFVAIVVQRSALAAIVPGSSRVGAIADLPGLRLGGSADSPHIAEFLATLDHLDVGRPDVAPVTGGDAHGALARGEIDVIVDFVDAVPRIERLTGIPLRAVPAGLDIYSSGLVASDAVPAETVHRVKAALVASLWRQREDPESGILELCQRYPETVPAEAAEGWLLTEPNIFAGPEPGSMQARRWDETLRFLCAARNLPQPPGDTVYRSEFLDADVTD